MGGPWAALHGSVQSRLVQSSPAVKTNVGASLLSFVPAYMTNGHHQKDGKCFEGKEPIDFVTRTEATGVSRLSGGDFFEPQRRYNSPKQLEKKN